ncbi:MAG: GNAT family N-acetyltransferase [Actinobacteria bacterium]|nr:GNAT family N-acetyltransferase [Actinomycetota bacterium]
MIELRVASSTDDLEAWAMLKSRVVPDEPITVEQLLATDEPARLLLLAELNGVLAGCGIGGLSGFGGKAFIMARVLPEHRRRGVGTELVRALAEHGRALGRTGVNSFVDAHDGASMQFALQLGLEEVDYQLEQVRIVGGEGEPLVPMGIEIEAVGERRDELLVELWPLAEEGLLDMPLPGSVTFPRATWLRDEATRPEGSFVARERDQIVGYAGLTEHANGDATAEHGLTFVRRDRRRRGIARALKQTQLRWAELNGVVELVTWTQKGNEAMQALNASLGYQNRSRALTMQGPIP